MFIGEYQHHLDSKGRLAIPAKFRASLKDGAVVTSGLDNCLFLFPKTAWSKLADRLAKLPLSQASSRAFARFMLAGAMAVDFDHQGRIILPEYLRQFASLKKKVVIAGLYDRLEIWDNLSWQKYKAKTEKNSGKIAETLKELGV